MTGNLRCIDVLTYDYLCCQYKIGKKLTNLYKYSKIEIQILVDECTYTYYNGWFRRMAVARETAILVLGCIQAKISWNRGRYINARRAEG